jgi:hypothetical protein
MTSDIVNKIMDFESGEMTSTEQIVDFFQELGDSGMIFSLQGHYHRVFNQLTEAGLVKIGSDRPDQIISELEA